jgi:very-short-patch-repair endonuclease
LSGACAGKPPMPKPNYGSRCVTLGGFKFVRQEAIGSYIVDFVCREKRLIVEVDGGQHADSVRDRNRDQALAADGYHIMRFWNSDVLSNRDGVLSVILAKLEEIDT